MIIGLDFDGVVMDTQRLKVFAAMSMYGLSIPGSHLESSYIKANPTSLISLEEYHALQEEIYVRNTFKTEVRFVDQAERAINTLLSNGHVLHIITSRDERAGLEQVKTLLSTVGLDIPAHGIGYNNSIRDKCQELGLNVFVDDDLEKLISLMGAVPHLYLFNTASTQLTNLPPGIQVVSFWSELLSKIEKLV